MQSHKQWTAALVVIGDEILSGRTQDRNIAQVAAWLNDQGIRLAEVRVVPDDRQRIADAVNALRGAHDYLFTTGGIGPTHDDITVDSIAAAFGVPVVVHPEARRILEEYYAARGSDVTEARLRMARVPQGAELIANPTSGAPGARIGNVYILAGVPHRARSPTCCARPRIVTPVSRSAATRFSRTAATAPISSCARKTAPRRGAARTSFAASWPRPATHPSTAGSDPMGVQ